jgi:RNA:NAD 2'-phosphotransferase (TPT1/KptA family)
MDPVRLSKKLALVLRHKAEEMGLRLDGAGYALLDDLLRLDMFKGVSEAQIEAVVASNDKKRFHSFIFRLSDVQGTQWRSMHMEEGSSEQTRDTPSPR